MTTITNDEEHIAALTRIHHLMDVETSPEIEELTSLAEAVEAYEEVRFPMNITNEQRLTDLRLEMAEATDHITRMIRYKQLLLEEIFAVRRQIMADEFKDKCSKETQEPEQLSLFQTRRRTCVPPF